MTHKIPAHCELSPDCHRPCPSDASIGLTGVVLAGGRSSRMGRDKTRLLLNGQDLLARTVHELSLVTPRVIVLGRDPGSHGLTGVEWLEDEIPGLGPIGGIATALRRIAGPCLVLACDLPRMNTGILWRLAKAHVEAFPEPCMTTYRQAWTGYIESLVAVYSMASLPLLDQAMAQGCRQLSAIIPSSLRQELPYTQEDSEPFLNLNYPADLEPLRTSCREVVAWPTNP